MIKRLGKKAFTLVEVLVCIVLIGIGLSAVIGVLVAGSFYLKRAELKSEAISVASTQMERFLAKSYGSLQAGVFNGQSKETEWKVEVEEETEGDCTGSTRCIPYKKITVSTFYLEEGAKTNTTHKRIQLTNIIPYPYIHIASKSIGATGQVATDASYVEIEGLTLDLSYPVDKDIMVIYNIAIAVEGTAGIEADDTIYTSCFLDGEQKLIETRTPIVTQPLINNIIEIDAGANGLTRNKSHKVEIKWYKETSIAGAGEISIKKSNIIVVAFEAKK